MTISSLRPMGTPPAPKASHTGAPTNNVRFSAIAAANDWLTRGPSIAAKAQEDVRFYVTRLTETMGNLNVLEQSQTSEGNPKKPALVETHAILGETGKHLEARIKANRALEQAFQTPYNDMPFHEVIRVAEQNSTGMWQVDSKRYSDGYTTTEIMPRSPGKAILYIGDQYRPLITVENGRGSDNKVTYRFPWSGSGYDKIAKEPIKITDAKLRKQAIGLAQRMVDKTTSLNLGQRLHRLVTYGYWTP